jgi:hypothetical protein
MVKNFVEEPANSSSTLNMEAERVSEMLVSVYKRLRRLVPRIPQYFKCRTNFRYYKGMSQGKRRRYGVRMPPEARDFSVLKNDQTGSGLTQTPVEWVQGVIPRE